MMPGPDEIRRNQHPISPALKALLATIPRRNPQESFNQLRQRLDAMRSEIGPPDVPDLHVGEILVNCKGGMERLKAINEGRCVICGTSLSPAGMCPRCLNLIP